MSRGWFSSVFVEGLFTVTTFLQGFIATSEKGTAYYKEREAITPECFLLTYQRYITPSLLIENAATSANYVI